MQIWSLAWVDHEARPKKLPKHQQTPSLSTLQPFSTAPPWATIAGRVHAWSDGGPDVTSGQPAAPAAMDVQELPFEKLVQICPGDAFRFTGMCKVLCDCTFPATQLLFFLNFLCHLCRPNYSKYFRSYFYGQGSKGSR